MTTDYRSLCADHSERIAALEAQRETEKAAILDIYEKLDRLKTQHESNWSRIVRLEEAANSSAGLTGSSAPAGGLVERVAIAVCRGDDSSTWREEMVNWTPEARAAILAVAAWLAAVPSGDGIPVARWLREEVERG